MWQAPGVFKVILKIRFFFYPTILFWIQFSFLAFSHCPKTCSTQAAPFYGNRVPLTGLGLCTTPPSSLHGPDGRMRTQVHIGSVLAWKREIPAWFIRMAQCQTLTPAVLDCVLFHIKYTGCIGFTVLSFSVVTKILDAKRLYVHVLSLAPVLPQTDW